MRKNQAVLQSNINVLPGMNPKVRVKAGINKKSIAKTKVLSITTLLISGAIVISFVAMIAFCALVQSQNNAITTKNEEIQNDLDHLNMEILRDCNIAKIEDKAMDMGMVYPGVDDTEYIY